MKIEQHQLDYNCDVKYPQEQVVDIELIKVQFCLKPLILAQPLKFPLKCDFLGLGYEIER